jgi:hypothetical protein
MQVMVVMVAPFLTRMFLGQMGGTASAEVAEAAEVALITQMQWERVVASVYMGKGRMV